MSTRTLSYTTQTERPTDSTKATFRTATPAELTVRAAHRAQAEDTVAALHAAAQALRDLTEIAALVPPTPSLVPAPATPTARRPQGAHAILALVLDLATCAARGHEGSVGADFGYRWRADRNGYTRRSRCKACEGEGRRPTGGR
jgi:hypothetical protein